MERVVWVDDDPDLLLLLRRSLGHMFAIETYEDARAALASLKADDRDVAVVAADMNMPGMDGVEFLAQVAGVCPRAVRLMFTGAGDQGTARKAVNEGNVYRFLTKGVEIDEIHQAVAEAMKEFHSKEAERRVLEDTMIGAVRALMDVVALVQPAAFGRATRIRQLVTGLATQMGCRSWEIELGASLSQLGCIVLPPLVMERIAEGREVAPQYEQMFQEHPAVGAELLAKIPRLELVAEIVRYQHKHFDGSGFPADDMVEQSIPLGSRFLKVAVDFDRLSVGGIDASAALVRMNSRSGWYDLPLLEALAAEKSQSHLRRQMVPFAALKPGMVLLEDLHTDDGAVVAARGQEVTRALAMRLTANQGGTSTIVSVLAA